MNVDPRLQNYTFNSNDFTFPTHPAPTQFDPSLNAYGIQQQSTTHPTNASPRRQAARNAAQGSPQSRMHGAQTPASSLSRPIPSPSNPAPQKSLPNDNLNANTSMQKFNGLVFKNSSSTYPRGISPREPTTIDFSGYLPPPPTNLHHNTAADYFSSAAPNTSPVQQPQPAPPSPPPTDSANPFSPSFPLVTSPPALDSWRHSFFNITTPLHLTSSQFLTYFPHIDNVYSHRSTQRYKRKPFVSHYWDCRLKGRPSGTKKSADPNVKRRKREKRELGLCDVKIKITEWFGREEAESLGMHAVALGEGDADFDGMNGTGATSEDGGLRVVIENDFAANAGSSSSDVQGRYPKNRPGADGEKWYTIQRVNGGGTGADGKVDDEEEGEEGMGKSLDHKHSLEESDRIKKNSVQRWILKEEKERRAGRKSRIDPTLGSLSDNSYNLSGSLSSSNAYLASGFAQNTVRLHNPPVATHLTFFANAFCPFAQRVWIALELKGIPYQFVEVTPETVSAMRNSPTSGNTGMPKDLRSVNPDINIPCIKHGNWGVWESCVMMEYLEDLSLDLGDRIGGTSLFPSGQPQLKAHCRLWVDHVNRKVLPAFYALLLTPLPRPTSGDDVEMDRDEQTKAQRHAILVDTLQTAITKLVNASHVTGPFFLGNEIGYVDVAFAPWILRLSRVMSCYRNFPRPEVGTRWQSWVDAIEADERIRRTVSEDKSYHGVYQGVGVDGVGGGGGGEAKPFVEIEYARRIMGEEGFGLGGDLYGHLGLDPGEPGPGRTHLTI